MRTLYYKCKVHKYKLLVHDGPVEQEITLTHSFDRVLSVAHQDMDIVVYVQEWEPITPAPEPKKLKFVVVGTGWDFDVSNTAFIGTVNYGKYMWHVFHKL